MKKIVNLEQKQFTTNKKSQKEFPPKSGGAREKEKRLKIDTLYAHSVGETERIFLENKNILSFAKKPIKANDEWMFLLLL